jgi:hypothetical protein
MVKKVIHKPPSRVRYEKNNPTVSCRVSKELYDNLDRVKKREGKSFTDILKLGLGEIEDIEEKVNNARTNGFNKGYQKGYAEAESMFKVTFRCNNCHQIIVVDDAAEKKAIDTYMSTTWTHQECPKPVVNRIPRKS